ncbi:histidine kinase [Ruminococcaceae bacterium OttesenSCG-928-A16]|nr:histidine kinase [Ruminococcaceae bacterium OttesenSCG-928-A16]
MKGLLYWFLGKASIRKKLVISFSVLVCIPILVLGVFSYNQAHRNIQAQTLSTTQSNLARLISEMDTRLQKEVDYTKYLAYNLNFRRALEIAAKNPVQLARQLNQNVEPMLWYFVASDSYISNMNIYSPNVGHSIGPFLKPDADFAEEDWYISHQKNFNTVWSFEKGRLFATRTVLDTGTSSRMIGILRAEIYLSLLLEPVESMKYMNNGVMLADQNSRIVYQKNSGNHTLDSLAVDYITGKTDENKAEELAFFEEGELTVSGWKVYYYVDKAAVTQQLTPIIRSTLIAVGLCLVLVLGLISWLSKLLSGRIMSLKTSAEQVAGGNFTLVQHTEDTDEIGVVTNSFATMAGQLQTMIDRVYKMEIDKKTTELKALQAMINPHFLYNCLSSLKWRAIYKDDEEMAHIAGLIAKFYRTSLNNGKQITTVRNEMENIKTYIELQQIMHKNSFEVVLNLQQEYLETPMLNFMLQPFVENAILHGLAYYEGTKGQGQLEVNFSVQQEFLVFEILNNGTRLDTARIDAILNKPGKGYGIYNIQQRIDLYYGKGSGVAAGVDDRGFTWFKIKLNKEKADV